MIARPPRRRKERARRWHTHHSGTEAHTGWGRAWPYPWVHQWRTSHHALSWWATHSSSHRRQRLYTIVQARCSRR